METEISKKIIEYIQVAEKSDRLNSDIQADRSFSRSYPEGGVMYFKKRVYELKNEIYKQTLIGHYWIQNDCPLDVLETEWIERMMAVNLKSKLFKEHAWPDLQLFVEKLMQLKLYETWIQGSQVFSENIEAIIEKERLVIIYRKYHDVFKESEENWTSRFCLNGGTVDPINISKEAREGSNRLVLLGILASVQLSKGSEFDYNSFVLKRFGIKNYQKAKTDHKEKQTFKDTLKYCNAILKI